MSWELLGMYVSSLKSSGASMIEVFEEVPSECLDAIVAWVRDPSSKMSCFLDLTSCPKIVKVIVNYLKDSMYLLKA